MTCFPFALPPPPFLSSAAHLTRGLTGGVFDVAFLLLKLPSEAVATDSELEVGFQVMVGSQVRKVKDGS
jgi:hypothetical protein